MPERRFFFLINRAQHATAKAADKRLGEQLQISTAHLGALFFLLKNDGCLLKELSRGLGLNNSAITGLAGRMELAGLIVRRPCERDGRASRVFLTELGKAKANSALPLVRKMNEELTLGFTDHELEIVARFLESATERLERRSAKPITARSRS